MRTLFLALAVLCCACSGDTLPTPTPIPQGRLSGGEVLTCCPGGLVPAAASKTVGVGTTVELVFQATFTGGLIDPDIVLRTSQATWTVPNSGVVDVLGLAQCPSMVSPTSCYLVRAKAPGTVSVSARYQSGSTEWQDSFPLTVQ